MRLVFVVMLTLLYISCFKKHLCLAEPKHQLPHETIDMRKVFDNFLHAIAIIDIDKDGDLDCLSTVRTDFDSSVPRATYVWILPGVNGREPRNITFEVLPKETPDHFYFTDKDGDGSPENGFFIYSDYKDCALVYLYERQECMMWSSREMKENVPQACMDQFEDNCEGAYKSYDEDTCRSFVSF
uniref:Putative lipocalin-5 1 n=1 Tax=Amblyomma triste TaxID=251400 RepID=A0A023G983_AMBTT